MKERRGGRERHVESVRMKESFFLGGGGYGEREREREREREKRKRKTPGRRGIQTVVREEAGAHTQAHTNTRTHMHTHTHIHAHTNSSFTCLAAE